MQKFTGYFPTESLEPNENRLFSRSALNEGYLFRGSLIYSFTIDFETAKTYRENVGMDSRFRRNAWHDLQVEVYI